MQECWVNVYKYGIMGFYYTKADALSWNRCALYRIHVKMKKMITVMPEFHKVPKRPELTYKITVTGNCGKQHSFKEWQECKVCAVPKYEPFYNRLDWIK